MTALARMVLLSLVAACGGSSTPKPIDAPMTDTSPPAKLVAYVSGGGPDITWYDVDRATGALTRAGSLPAFAANPSFLAIDPAVTHLYAVSEGTSQVGAYAIDRSTGALTFINAVGSGGNGPAHLSVDRGGHYVLVANYGDGQIAVLPIRADGGVAPSQQTLAAGVRAHMIVTAPANDAVLVPCLGSSYIAQYTFAPASGALTANSVPHASTASGAGPRHLAFSPDARHAYLINELDSTITAFTYDAATGRLAPIHTLSSRAAGATGTNTGAEIWVHPAGTVVYASNRGDNTIAVFARDAQTGRLSPLAQVPTQGATPRDFTLDPEGRFLYVANQGSNSVVPFAIDAAGQLAPTAAPITVPSPTFVGIVPLP